MENEIRYSEEILFDDGIKVICDLSFPELKNNLSNGFEEKFDVVMSIVSNQYKKALGEVINDYKNSTLPQRFIMGQKIVVTTLPKNLYGLFSLIGDTIFVDYNTISGLYSNVGASFLFGHEMGHKISQYIDRETIYRDLSRILDISLDGNYYKVDETFADECGNIVSPMLFDHGVLPVPLDTHKRNGVKKLILSSIYR